MEAATTTANTSSQNTVTPTGQQNPHPRRNTRNRYANRARNQTNQPGDSAGQPQDSSTSDNNRPPRKTGESQRPRRPPRSHDLPSRPVIAPHASSSNQQDVSREQSIESGAPRHTQNRGKLPTSNNAGETTSPATGETQSYPPTRPRTGRRGAKFGAGLTEPSEKTTDSPSSSITKKNHPKRKPSPPSARPDDLTSNLIHAMRTPPYPDCAICFSGIHPAQPTWSCSPSLILPQGTDSPQQNTPDNGTAQCCWTTFHLKCIRSWAAKSVKDLEDAWRARGETRKGEWRCPGCQFKREAVPTVYKCFCGFTPDPKPPRLATPHSCANSCSRARLCGHPCALQCHPGPCPPCTAIIHQPCYCGKQVQSFRCSRTVASKLGPDSRRDEDRCCGNVCGKKLGCGNHTCAELCHEGDCAPCKITDMAKCYCGKVEQEMGCGEGQEQECFVDGEQGQSWKGRFECTKDCERFFDCGVHKCSKTCHPPSSSPPPCPQSPSLVTHCPCGKHALSKSSANFFPASSKLSRCSCSDPIPTCTSSCTKALSGCNHVCASPCHTGPCPPCTMRIVRPCRCGSTTKDVICSDLRAHVGGDNEILCDRACVALRSCGRHQCNRICCPLAPLAITGKGKAKKRAGREADVLDAMDEGGLHECDLVCGKMLGCGNHPCEHRDHKGPCPPCFMSSFEEAVCHCGRTVVEPPIPCGTRIDCRYPCSRPPPACGHPHTLHSCHEDPSPCPPCPFLTKKQCACGKKTVDNVKCSQKRVSCGQTCGKLLGCGFHHCDKLCHGDDCGPCNIACGKPRKLCLPVHHPCTLTCHAPASCSEMDPCLALITLTCPCGRIRSSVACGRSTSSPAGREARDQLKCSNECHIAKRNARLAEALGIDPEKKERKQEVVYTDNLVAFARTNFKFLTLVENTFSTFIMSEKKTQVLPHMPPERRSFVHNLAMLYRMDTQMVDQEPNRSVQLIRRIDTRIPTPLLSESLTSTLGKLANLRGGSPVVRTPTPHTTSGSSSRTPHAPVGRWTSVISGAGPSVNTNTAASSSSGSVGSAWRKPPPATHVAAAPQSSQAVVSLPVENVDVPESWEDDV